LHLSRHRILRTYIMPNLFLNRYAYPNQFITDKPHQNLNIIISIPCFNEPNLILTLNSLHQCERPNCPVEIIVVINEPENANAEVSRQNQATFEDATHWVSENDSDNFITHIIYINDLPAKHAGVGLARKIAMDEAVRRFESIDNQSGIIACFDADSACDKNYLIELEKHFQENPKNPGCSIYFEHPLDVENSDAIIYYELFLRYYVNALRHAGFPYAYETIGSSMAVRSWAYQKQGGMNRRKAGEDFYFLHRIIPLGHFTELNSTRIIPSPRTSDRVPFGTGRSMMDWKSGNKDLTKTYNPQTFEDLKLFFDCIKNFYESPPTDVFPDAITGFLTTINFTNELDRIKKQSTSPSLFRKHFFHWFDGFKVLKFVHFARDKYHPQIEMSAAIEWVLKIKGDGFKNLTEALMQLRKHDKASFHDSN